MGALGSMAWVWMVLYVGFCPLIGSGYIINRCSVAQTSNVPFVQRIKHRMPSSNFQQYFKQFPSSRSDLKVHGMFDGLKGSMSNALKMIGKDEKLTPENIKKPMKQIRRALLEADVSLPIVRRFVASVENKVLSMDLKVSKALSPEQQLIKVVYEELTTLMGSKREDLAAATDGPRIVLMAGLQGVGKTTQTGKLASLLKRQNQRVLLASLDVYRPAAMIQLKKLAEAVEVDVMEPDPNGKPLNLARAAIHRAKTDGFDVVILDTAGRLQIDDEMIGELKEVSENVHPTDTLLVVDAMTGQEAAKVVKAFSEAVPLTGAILTKLDGDSRGGAALSVKEVAGKPIKFVGVGEKMNDLDPFYPDRMAQRILGMGDMLSLIEKAEEAISETEAKSMEEKLKEGSFDYNDFKEQFKMMARMGPFSQISSMIPGMQATDKQLSEGERRMRKFSSMIDSMNTKERKNPVLFDKYTPGSQQRRRRVVKGSGKTLEDFEEMHRTLKTMRATMGQLMGKEPAPIKYVIPRYAVLINRFSKEEMSQPDVNDYFTIDELEKSGINMDLAPHLAEPEKYPTHYANMRNRVSLGNFRES
mmetsp:Transcript_16130/g.24332  ORF Transcript_16130/g.24332 Transcript_16130/m.24332 type:complete len:586 (+) Transcript_16130:45-1802(+)